VSITTLLYILLALLLSVGISFFQYFFKVKKAPKNHIILFFLRVVSIFLLFLLFINPQITLEETTNIKPKLSVLIDNSKSTSFFKEEQFITDFITKVKSNKQLTDKFELDIYGFGAQIQQLDSFSFTDSKTDINKAISSINNLHKKNLGGMVLLTDGNQTLGEDYEFLNSKQAVFPLVIGDTIQYKDIKISQLNINKYSYLNNKFPVEAFINYEGRSQVNSEFSIYKNGKKVFSKSIKLSPENKSVMVTANLTSDKEGVHYYSASLTKLDGEKNIRNNTKNFTVEVIDEQAKVLIVSSIVHPDLGALKKSIETNKQRKVDLAQINAFKGNINEYQFVVFYQPNQYFKSLLTERKSNFIIITGAKTDWRFINSLDLGFSKIFIQQSENYRPIYNSNFLTYLQKDIGFDGFPPLKDKFGKVTTTDHQSLLYQNLKGISTTDPLLSTFEKGERKYAVIFGEGIWKWRASSYVKENSFESFDEFIGNLTQYLSSNKKRKRLDVKLENLYLANENIGISALYLDKNYKFDARASLELRLKNIDTGIQKVYPFSLVNTSYQLNLEGLDSGNYEYRVIVEGQSISKSGTFKVADFEVEQQFSSANYKKLEKLANRTEGKLFFKNQENTLFENLIKNERFFTVQKSNTKKQDLIHWKWILFIVVGLLALEWFLRKYFGKI